MTRYARQSRKPWSKLKSRVEALFAPELQLAIHCNVFIKVCQHWVLRSPATGLYWVVDVPV